MYSLWSPLSNHTKISTNIPHMTSQWRRKVRAPSICRNSRKLTKNGFWPKNVRNIRFWCVFLLNVHEIDYFIIKNNFDQKKMQNKKVGLQQPPLPPIFEDLPHPHNGVWVKKFFSKKCVSGGVTTIHSHMVACASVLARLGKNLRGGVATTPPPSLD